MNGKLVELAEQRRALSTLIARQRGELHFAYQQLEKPVGYVEYGLQVISYLRRHPWIPAAGSLGFSLIVAKIMGSLGGKKKAVPSRSQDKIKAEALQAETAAGWTTFLALWSSRAWQAYQLYRRLRPLFP